PGRCLSPRRGRYRRARGLSPEIRPRPPHPPFPPRLAAPSRDVVAAGGGQPGLMSERTSSGPPLGAHAPSSTISPPRGFPDSLLLDLDRVGVHELQEGHPVSVSNGCTGERGFIRDRMRSFAQRCELGS